jgi:hypothetical protein
MLPRPAPIALSSTLAACALLMAGMASAQGTNPQRVHADSLFTEGQGGCQPDAQIDIPDAAWGTAAVACAPGAQSAAGCPGGQVCVPAPGSPFESGFCVIKAGDNACPPGFTTQHLYYGGFDDSRGCTPCACATPTGVDCNSAAHISTWSNTTCTSGKGAAVSGLPAACASMSGIHYVQITTYADGGSCTPSGGQPTGAASPEDLTTLCCAP